MLACLFMGLLLTMPENAFAREAKDSFLRFGLRPFPQIRIVEPERLKRGEYARAVRYESGKEEIWVTRETGTLEDLHTVIDHESAHIRTWRDYGIRVQEHGPQWRSVCRKHALSLKACEPKR